MAKMKKGKTVKVPGFAVMDDVLKSTHGSFIIAVITFGKNGQFGEEEPARDYADEMTVNHLARKAIPCVVHLRIKE